MTIERSHGKTRPTLVRASDSTSSETDANPRQGRTPGGHFAAGNRLGIGARWKATLRPDGFYEGTYFDADRIGLAWLVDVRDAFASVAALEVDP